MQFQGAHVILLEVFDFISSSANPYRRIGETDPPACGFRMNVYQMAGNRGD